MANINILFPPVVDTYPSFFVEKDNIPLSFQTPSESEEWTSFDYIIREALTNIEIANGNINKSDYDNKIPVKESLLNLNTYYKLQLRFIIAATADLSEIKSEWSAPMLIRRISTPSINNLIIDDFLNISFNFKFDDSFEKEIFSNYYVEYWDRDNDILLERSEVIKVLDYFKDNFIFSYFPKKDYIYLHDKGLTNVKIILFYETGGGYKNFIEKEVVLSDTTLPEESVDDVIEAVPNLDFGYIKVTIKLTNGPEPGEKLILKRASHKSNFTKFEIIGSFTPQASKTFYWNDITANIMTFYKYRIERYRDGKETYKESNICILKLDSIFLTDQKEQFKIEFNPQVSSYKKILNENIINTLGSKYPFIRRGGETNYTQFVLNGLISFLGDPSLLKNEVIKDSIKDISQTDNSLKRQIIYYSSPLFFSETEEFKNLSDLMNTLNTEDFDNNDREFLLENMFRERAINFLTNGKPKLFRSPTEKNMIVYLSNVSFTPNESLGRRVWNFSATATEIGEADFESLKSLKVLNPLDLDGDGIYYNVLLGYTLDDNAATTYVLGTDPNVKEGTLSLSRVSYCVDSGSQDIGTVTIFQDDLTFYEENNINKGVN